MLAKPHSLSQQIRWLFYFSILIALSLRSGNIMAFENSIADKTLGNPYPHILKKETFTINTRNIKVLKANDNHLWIGTSNGLLRFDTSGKENIKVFDNTNALLSLSLIHI